MSEPEKAPELLLQLQLLVGAHGWRTPSSARTTRRTLSRRTLKNVYSSTLLATAEA
jgi:hypothetical protein